MRAVYLEAINDMKFELKDEKCHHLLNVIRLKQGEELLLLDGRGNSKKAIADKIEKKKITLLAISDKIYKEPSTLQIAMGIPKKEALELCLKQAVEIGVTKIYLVQTEYSQKLTLNEERIERILISALEQSNNHWLPNLEIIGSLEELLNVNKGPFLYFSSQQSKKKNPQIFNDKTLLLIGPEGGLSLGEEKFLQEQKIPSIHFESAIMRTPTALSFGVGFLRGRIDKLFDE